jgi:twitching motility protein PilT
MARLDAFLQLGHGQGVSDMHFAVGIPPMFRMSGDLLPIQYRAMSNEELEELLREILNDDQLHDLDLGRDIDFSYECEGVGRFRSHIYRKTNGVGAAFRVIASRIPDLHELGLPPVVETLMHNHQGLILVTGATGTGKTSTLAAMIHYLNHTKRYNMITLEDPIEFVHESQLSLVVQREVGRHVGSFSEGLRAALREDPDVILVGELRDTETISLAMMAAETGHLVLGTLHTTSAAKTLDRIIDGLPAEQKAQGVISLAQSLRGVISQVLVRTMDGRGRRAIVEILVMTHAISKLLTTGKAFQIPMLMETGRSLGMQLMDQALLEAVRNKEVDPNDAYLYAQDKKSFLRYITDTSLLPTDMTAKK